jgi:hypothetical protein
LYLYFLKPWAKHNFVHTLFLSYWINLVFILYNGRPATIKGHHQKGNIQ